jgi:hypothetical protein
MDAFVDPRAERAPDAKKPPARTTAIVDELVELHRLCREGRLYDVERWIQMGRPLQVAQGTDKRRPVTSALEIALQAGNQALVLLLLANGYDPNQEFNCPLDVALRARRFDLVNLLLEWGADPHRVSLSDLFDAYSSELFTRFRELGVDLTAGHALAEALAYHTSNKPLFGFAKRYRERDPKVQAELDIALAHHAGEGNEKGVQLCLWAGADPHAPVPSLRYGDVATEDTDETDDGDRFVGFSAVHEACQRGNIEILNRLGPDPARDDFDELWRVAGNGAVIQLLAQRALPRDIGAVIQHHLWWATFDTEGWRSVETLRRLFEVGVRWERSSAEEIGGLRRSLLKASDRTFVDLMKLLATEEYCSPEVLRELARTPAMRTRMRKVGFIPPSPDERHRFGELRPTRSREVLKKFGVEIPKPPKAPPTPAPRSVRIGPRHPNGQEIQLDREELYERVWSKPVAALAREWGLSGPGLKKVCRRLEVPVPPRGYWAKLKAGKHVRRPRLPAVEAGKGEEVPIRASQ